MSPTVTARCEQSGASLPGVGSRAARPPAQNAWFYLICVSVCDSVTCVGHIGAASRGTEHLVSRRPPRCPSVPSAPEPTPDQQPRRPVATLAPWPGNSRSFPLVTSLGRQLLVQSDTQIVATVSGALDAGHALVTSVGPEAWAWSEAGSCSATAGRLLGQEPALQSPVAGLPSLPPLLLRKKRGSVF